MASSQADALTNQFFDRYLNEYDYRLAGPGIPIDPQTYGIVRDLVIATAGGVLVKLGENAYRRIRDALRDRLRDPSKRPPTVVHVQGSIHGLASATVLEFGKTRPLVYVQKGHVLVLHDLTLAYVGPSKGLFRIEQVPALVFDNVRLVRVGKRREKVGYFQIHSPLFSGKNGENPYAGRTFE